MLAIVFFGVIQHEIPGYQLQQIVDKARAKADCDTFVVCNGNGIFASAPRLSSQVETIFDSGIDLMFLGEQAIARNAGRNELLEGKWPLIRPANLPGNPPGTGAKLIAFEEQSFWFFSLAQGNRKIPLDDEIDCLESFLTQKEDDFPVIVYLNGQDLEMKQACIWRFSNRKCKIHILGTGLNQATRKISNRSGSLSVLDIGAIKTRDSIGGLAPEIWWKKTRERIPGPNFPDSSPLEFEGLLVKFNKGGQLIEANFLDFAD